VAGKSGWLGPGSLEGFTAQTLKEQYQTDGQIWHCHSEQQYQSHMTSNWPGIQIFRQSVAKAIRVYFRIVQQYESHMNTIICEHNSQVVFSL